ARIVQYGSGLDSRRGTDRAARELTELDHRAAPLFDGASLPVAAVNGSHRPEARKRELHRPLLRAARASAASEQRETADQRDDAAGNSEMQLVYGFEGVVNHGQLAVS